MLALEHRKARQVAGIAEVGGTEAEPAERLAIVGNGSKRIGGHRPQAFGLPAPHCHQRQKRKPRLSAQMPGKVGCPAQPAQEHDNALAQRERSSGDRIALFVIFVVDMDGPDILLVPIKAHCR